MESIIDGRMIMEDGTEFPTTFESVHIDDWLGSRGEPSIYGQVTSIGKMGRADCVLVETHCKKDYIFKGDIKVLGFPEITF
jgi:hypothetical protein